MKKLNEIVSKSMRVTNCKELKSGERRLSRCVLAANDRLCSPRIGEIGSVLQTDGLTSMHIH